MAGRKKGSPKTGGRRVGSANKVPSPLRAKTKKIVADALEGLTPLEVMLDNMRFAHQAAEAILRRLIDGGATPPDGFTELAKLVEFRAIAQTSAKDAAPYCHSRLATTELKGSLTIINQEDALDALD
jgi:hypothetical protein